MVLKQENIEKLLEAIYDIEQNPIRIEPQGDGEVVVETSAPMTIKVNRSVGDIQEYMGSFNLPAYDAKTVEYRGSDLAPLKEEVATHLAERATHMESLKTSRASLLEALAKLNEMPDGLTLDDFYECVNRLYSASAGQAYCIVNAKGAYELGQKLMACNSIVEQFGSDEDKGKFANLENALANAQEAPSVGLYTGQLRTPVAAQAFFMAYQMKQRQAAQTV